MRKRMSCREARRAMQDALDRSDPVSQSEMGELSRFLSGEVKAHLERCLGCRDFLRSLDTFGPLLRSQLDDVLRDYPVPEVALVLRGTTEEDAQVPSPLRNWGAATSAVFRRLHSWLFGLVGKSTPVYRWVAVSAIAVLLASFIGIRIYSVSATHRVIEQQIDRIVELIYQEPLLPGVESALLRTRPSISDYVEDLEQSVDSWLEETTSQSYLN